MILQMSVVGLGYPMQIRKNYVNNINGEASFKLMLLFATFLTRMGQTYVDGAVYITVPDLIAVLMIGITISQIWYPRNSIAGCIAWLAYPLSKFITIGKSIHKTIKIRSLIVEALREYDTIHATNLITSQSYLDKIIVAKESTFSVKRQEEGYNLNIIMLFENKKDEVNESVMTITTIVSNIRQNILDQLDAEDKIYFESFIGDEMIKKTELN